MFFRYGVSRDVPARVLFRAITSAQRKYARWLFDLLPNYQVLLVGLKESFYFSV